MSASKPKSPRIALFISSLQCGGAERVVVNLLQAAVEQGLPVDLLLARAEGPLLAEVPAAVRVVELGVQKLQHGIPRLARYLRRERPYGVVSHITHANVAMLLARMLACTDTRTVVVEHSNLSATLAGGVVRPRVVRLARSLYPRASAIVGVSSGVARDVERHLALEPRSVRPIFNPVVNDRLLTLAAAPCAEAWLPGGAGPLLLTAGRLEPQKDYATLLRALALVRRSRPARLVILGEGSQRAALERLRRELGLDAHVVLPGVSDNPFAAMRAADLFVLSSRFEGLGNVLVEALACGCPVVATDCPSGPAEILADGQFGVLVPPEQPESLAAGILAALDRTWDRAALERRGREFTAASSLAQYLEVLDYPLARRAPQLAAGRNAAAAEALERPVRVRIVTASEPPCPAAKPRLAIFLPSLRGGGAERMMVNLVHGLTMAGIPVDLLLGRAEGPYLADVPAGVRVIGFDAAHVRQAIWPLARYLRQERPYGILSRMMHANLATLIAARLARVETKVAVIEAVQLTAGLASGEITSPLVSLARWLYPRAGAIVGVSEGVAADMQRVLRLPADRVRTIYNPVVDARLEERCRQPSPHPWLSEAAVPVLMSAGRLEPQKDHATLLRAFALVRKERPARLVIFGEGKERSRLESLCRELGVDRDVDLPGFADNACAAMSRAALYVLSSRFEGLPNALIEALACGCPAVATDCPSGPAEILAGGRYGMLVPPGNPEALAGAMATALDHAWDRAALRRRGAEFSLDASLAQYLDALDYPLAQSKPAHQGELAAA